jgi:hypothetical protein
MKNKILLHFLSLAFLVGLIACNSEASEKSKLKKECASMLASDVKGVLKSTLDGSTMGLGSMILNFAISEKQQDSLVISPIIKDVNKALDKKTLPELRDLKTNKAKRYLLIVEALKEKAPVLKESFSKYSSTGGEIIDALINNFQNTTK